MDIRIVKRNGKIQPLNLEKIRKRIERCAEGLKVDTLKIVKATVDGLKDMITSRELDSFAINTAASYILDHPDYSQLAVNLQVSGMQKDISSSFMVVTRNLHKEGMVTDEYLAKVKEFNRSIDFNEVLDYRRDFNFAYFGLSTLRRGYLMNKRWIEGGEVKSQIMELPQQMYMRLAIHLGRTPEEAVNLYNQFSRHIISPATPIYLGSGTKSGQLASCVLQYFKGDSLEGITGTLSDMARISADGAGIGICITPLRSKESIIGSSYGNACGVLRVLKAGEAYADCFNQRGKRKAGISFYIEPWHRDIIDFLSAKRHQGAAESRARNLFYGLWVPDLFMKQLQDDGDWYLFCPKEIEDAGYLPLQDLYGEQFEKQYWDMVDAGLGKKVKARYVWNHFLETDLETGSIYVLFKDAINRKTNHSHFAKVEGGASIMQSNLCTEIYQHTAEDTTATCILASQVLQKHVVEGGEEGVYYDFESLGQAVSDTTIMLNVVCDTNRYSTPEAEKGGRDQRAIGIGTQGLADTFCMMGLSYESEEAAQLEQKIFETIYYYALKTSIELAKNGEFDTYKDWEKSPMGRGILQFDMWGTHEDELLMGYDWETIRRDLMLYGACNSLLTTSMPTASSANITGSAEMNSPFKELMFVREVISGDFAIVNKYLVADLEALGIWNRDMRNDIIMNDGSIQNIDFTQYMPEESTEFVRILEKSIKDKYKTVWELPTKMLIDRYVSRGRFMDQGQSQNLFMENPTGKKLTSAIFYSWKQGAKSAQYYLRSKNANNAAKHLAIDVSKKSAPSTCSIDNPDCEACGA